MDISSDMIDGSKVLLLGGTLDSIGSNELIIYFENDVHNTYDNLIIDMKNLSFVSSAGLRVLININKKYRNMGKSITIKNINPLINDVFKATGFYSMMHIIEREE